MADDQPTQSAFPNDDLDIRPGDLAPCWYSREPNQVRTLSEPARLSLKKILDSIAHKDVAARRWEVQQSWESRLYDRGYQVLIPRRGGGWIVPVYAATDYNVGTRRRRSAETSCETNIYATYGEIITAALTRDITEVIWEPGNPKDDVDKTAVYAAERYARYFARQNDLLTEHQQLVYYLRNDGRAVAIVDHIRDAQRFGRCPPPQVVPVNPETEAQEEVALAYVIRHDDPDAQPGAPENQQHLANAAEYLQKKGVGRVIASTAPDGYDFGQQLNSALGLPTEVDADERFAPHDRGEELEGEAQGDARGPTPPVDSDESREPSAGGESEDELDERVGQGFRDAIAPSALGSTPPAAIAAHDSVISSMFRTIHNGQVPPTDSVPPGGIAGIFPVGQSDYTIRQVYPRAQEPGALPAEKSDPRGAEIVEFVGKLEAKVVPINAQRQSDLTAIQISREYDFTLAKAMFPDFAAEIQPGSAGSGENQFDRIARINACTGLEATYVTGDSMVRDCTIQRTWLRPSNFMEEEDPAVRAELITSFPEGCLGIIAGEAFVMARNENMDDHLTVIQALPGSGMNRAGLLHKLLSIQKRINAWVDLINDFFLRTVPHIVRDTALFNMAALKDQDATPGNNIGVTRTGIYANPTVPISSGIFVEPTPTPQPAMGDFIQYFINDLAQLLSGAMPALFGSDSNMSSNVGSMGYAVQRDQALGRLATPWHAIQMGTANYFRQAVQLAAECRDESEIYSAGEPGDAVKIMVTQLDGNVLAFPAEDPEIPDSWNQRQARYQVLIQEAATNPFIAGLLAQPQNAQLAVDVVRLEGFSIPEAEAWEKQLGEFQLLLTNAPTVNPQRENAIQQRNNNVASGLPLPAGIDEQIAAMPAQLPNPPPDDDPDLEDNATEAACCMQWMNGPEGRKYKNGTANEKAAFQNVRLHWKIHAQRAVQKQQQAMAAQQPPPKPPSVNFKDLPPRAGAVALQRIGLPASPEELQGTQQVQ